MIDDDHMYCGIELWLFSWEGLVIAKVLEAFCGIASFEMCIKIVLREVMLAKEKTVSLKFTFASIELFMG